MNPVWSRVNNVPIVRDRDVGFASMNAITPARVSSPLSDAAFLKESPGSVLSRMANTKVSLVWPRRPPTNDSMKFSWLLYGPCA